MASVAEWATIVVFGLSSCYAAVVVTVVSVAASVANALQKKLPRERQFFCSIN